jgi:hypothetical protein
MLRSVVMASPVVPSMMAKNSIVWCAASDVGTFDYHVVILRVFYGVLGVLEIVM